MGEVCLGERSGNCQFGTVCEIAGFCQPVAGRYGGECTVAGSKCEVDHSVCSAEATCECTPPYTPNQVFECVVIIGVLIAVLAFCMLLGMAVVI
ncbi:hypothetical protein ACOMHN_047178 [Nucella lapillus]